MKILPSPPGTSNVLSNEGYNVIEAENADAFLTALSPVLGFGAKLPHRTFIYRGQQLGSWSLIPQSRRGDTWPLPMSSRAKDTWNDRILSEAEALFSFCQFADRRGLLVPNWPILREALLVYITYLPSGHEDIVRAWPPPEAAPALALAQHYGLPTCLLDFTWDPYVAAYFAVCSLVNSEHLPDYLSVWVIDDYSLSATYFSERHRVRLLVPPASDNRTLQAQDGLFMWLPIDTALLGNWDGDYHPTIGLETELVRGPQTQVTKMILHGSEAPMLLHKLIKLGYDASHLFPTYSGAAKAVKEHDWARIGDDGANLSRQATGDSNNNEQHTRDSLGNGRLTS